jgi:hypothetical protein
MISGVAQRHQFQWNIVREELTGVIVQEADCFAAFCTDIGAQENLYVRCICTTNLETCIYAQNKWSH